MVSVSVIGSHALFLFLIGAGFFIANLAAERDDQ